MGGVVRKLFRPKAPRTPAPTVVYTREQVDQLGRNAVADANFRRGLQGLPPLPTPEQTQAQAPSVQQAAEEIAEAVNPRDVVYAGDSADQTGRRSRRRRTRRGTMLTGGRGVTGDAPTDRKTLLGS